jgi:hypothetical protein
MVHTNSMWPVVNVQSESNYTVRFLWFGLRVSDVVFIEMKDLLRVLREGPAGNYVVRGI